ncbi:MAG: hypothetical protein NDJ90_10215 [Oligoflexia bacterium]|nr:hypothetical protein [Oligoflexia bacterium]
MILRRFPRIAVSLLVAAGLLLGVFHLDRRRAQGHETVTALRWARQITSQAETMALSARSRGEKDSLKWAVDYLTQGVEPRIIRVNRFASLPADGSGDLEVFRLDRSRGVFDYSRVIDHANRSGIRVLLDVGFSGFLGARSRLANDLSLAAFFAAAALLLHFLVVPLFARKSDEQALAPVQDAHTSEPPPIELSGWRHDARAALAALGTSVRDLIRDAQAIARTARGTLAATESLRGRIHGGLNDLHASRKLLKNAAQLATQLEALVSAPETPGTRAQLQAIAVQLQQACQGGDQAVRALEILVEPWALDADQLVQAQQGSIAASRDMATRIGSTKEHLIQQVELLKKLEALAAAQAEAAAEDAVDAQAA